MSPPDAKRLSQQLRQPYDIYKGGYCDQYTMGLMNQAAQAMDDAVSQEVGPPAPPVPGPRSPVSGVNCTAEVYGRVTRPLRRSGCKFASPSPGLRIGRAPAAISETCRFLIRRGCYPTGVFIRTALLVPAGPELDGSLGDGVFNYWHNEILI